MPSEARTWGEFRILVLLSLSTACSSMPGSVVEKSDVDRWPSCASVTEVPVTAGVVVVPAVVAAPRGVKFTAPR